MSKPVSQASINLKLSDDLKEKIKTKAELKQLTISKYIRELLLDYFDGTLCRREVVKNQENEFVNSTDFLQLVVWVYSIKRSSKFKEKADDLDNYIKTLKKVDNHLPKYLVVEFDKVLSDVLRVINENTAYSKEYRFANGYSASPEFNFDLLEKYLLTYGKRIIVPDMSYLNLKEKP
ncbi:hypothetical protein [Mariniflexile sp. AS56]|uniref:hypothetical protein n=1 Tax=Mariniflexile sp. AS56 TaxID=3063957 RepID=UPI0026F2777B|nr:hypothetical protein [Mariniflexile sp. AS56]MDO7173907.1 hypothetical protein [Mariniflexile sp. AS56]